MGAGFSGSYPIPHCLRLASKALRFARFMGVDRRSTSSVSLCGSVSLAFWSPVLQCVAVCCSVLQCVAVCCSVLQCVTVCCSVLQYVAVCCSVLQFVAVCFSVLQCFVVPFHNHYLKWFGKQKFDLELARYPATHCNTLYTLQLT